MKYIVINNNEVFYTDWFDIDNHYVDGMIVINRATDLYYNGYAWFDIMEDHL